MQSRRFEYPPPLPFSFCSRCGGLRHLASVLIAHFGMPCAFIFQYELIILSAKPCRYTTTCYSISNAFCWAFNLCAAHITLHQAAKLRSGTRVDLFPVPVIRQTRIPYTPVYPPLREWWCGALGITSKVWISFFLYILRTKKIRTVAASWLQCFCCPSSCATTSLIGLQVFPMPACEWLA